MYVRAIVSSTDFDNFFALRAHKDAQPEIRTLAYDMLDNYNMSKPKVLKAGEGHIPFGDKINTKDINFSGIISGERGGLINDEKWYNNEVEKVKVKIAIARCARVSYFNYEGKDDYQADVNLCNRLFGSVPRHLSPTEHVAQALDSSIGYGNFKGFKQYRYTFEDQNLQDKRVIKK